MSSQTTTADTTIVQGESHSLWDDAVTKIRRNKTAMACFFLIVGYVMLALLCKFGFIFSDFATTNQALAYKAPSWDHIFGTDIFGRDVLARVSHGTITSLTVGVVSTFLSIIIGTTLGALAGYFGKWIDDAVVWLYSTLDTIPYILLLASFSFVMGPGLKTICIAIGLTSWVSLCRLVRSEFMKHRNKEYVQGAIAIGASHARRIFLHILPNVMHLVLISFSLGFISAVKSEVILSFLGLGVEPGTPSWGTMIDDSKLELARGVWWNLGAATLFMFGLVLAFNLFNDALRDALDPKLKNK